MYFTNRKKHFDTNENKVQNIKQKKKKKDHRVCLKANLFR